MLDAMTGFKRAWVAALSGIAAQLDALKTQSAPVWMFSHSGDYASVVRAMLTAIPAASSVFCTAVMFAGDESVRWLAGE